MPPSKPKSKPARPAGKLNAARIAQLAAKRRGWKVVGARLRREFRFKDFAAALDFVNRIGAEAEALQHHPDLELGWGRVAVALSTHDAGGLTEADFVLAARIDNLHAALAAH